MAVTLSTDVFIPEIVEGVVTDTVPGKLRIAQLATLDQRLVATPGSKVKVVKRKRPDGLNAINESDIIVPIKLTHDEDEYVVHEFGDGVEITDTALEDSGDNLMDYAAQWLSEKYAKRLDAEVAKAAVTGVTLSQPLASASAITYAEIVDGFAKFEDLDDDLAGLIVTPALKASLLKDKDYFIPSNRESVNNGAFGSLLGAPVYVTSRMPAGIPAIAIRRGALKVYVARNWRIEGDRDPAARTSKVFGTTRYGAARVDDFGVVAFTAP